LRCVTYLVVNKPKEYDAVSIILCLAQNGGVCDVQKEVGVRMVYAQMTGQQDSDNAATSLEGSLAQLLQATRESLTEKTAISIIDSKGLSNWGEGIYNTHDLFPIRNSMCEVMGLPRIPDPNSTDKPMNRDWVKMFLENYSASYIVEIVMDAMNDKDNRKIQYDPAIEWFTTNAPDGYDPYDFAEEVVFNMETGEFTKEAVIYMLAKERVLQQVSDAREEELDVYLDKYQSEAEKAAEEERKKKEAAEAEAAEARRVQEEILQREREEAEAKRKADAEAFAAMSPEERAVALAAMSPEERLATLKAMSPEDQAATLAAMSPEDKEAALVAMSPEDRYKQRQLELKEGLTDEDLAIVEELKNWGFAEEAIIQCYLACEKDRDLAVNLLSEM